LQSNPEGLVFLQRGFFGTIIKLEFLLELLSATRPSTLTLTAEPEVLKPYESCYRFFSYFKPRGILKASERKSLCIEELANIFRPLWWPIRQPQHADATWRGPRLQHYPARARANAIFPKPSLSQHSAQITRLPDEESPSIIPCLTTASRSALSLALIWLVP
jgi:hypothetical protein